MLYSHPQEEQQGASIFLFSLAITTGMLTKQLADSCKLMFFRLIAKYRPPVPVFAVVIPRLRSNSLKWTCTGSAQVIKLSSLHILFGNKTILGSEICLSMFNVRFYLFFRTFTI